MTNKEKNDGERTIFEKIAAGEIPSHKIYEDDLTYAFLDNSPHNPGHTLVIPKKPYENIYELDKEIIEPLFERVQKIAVAVKKAVAADGINIIMNNGSAAGQIVFHAHVHVIPRFKNDSWPKKCSYGDGEAEEVAARISKEILK